MKKYIFMAVAGMLALSSCSNDDNDMTPQNAPRQMTFTAGYNEGAQTRATMDFSTKKVSFDANDEISILSAKNTNTKFTTTAGGASATFSGTAVNDSKFYAVYPYTAGLTLSGDVISGVVIPSDQWNDKWGNDISKEATAYEKTLKPVTKFLETPINKGVTANGDNSEKFGKNHTKSLDFVMKTTLKATKKPRFSVNCH